MFLAVGMLVSTYLVLGLLAVTYARPLVSVFIQGKGAGAVVDVGVSFLYIIAPTWG